MVQFACYRIRGGAIISKQTNNCGKFVFGSKTGYPAGMENGNMLIFSTEAEAGTGNTVTFRFSI